MRNLVLLSLLTVAVNAQSLSVGVIGGVPLTDVIRNASDGSLQWVPTSTNFTIGPSVRVNLPAGLRLEVDALYRPYGFSLFNSKGASVLDVSAQQWRFPALLQYRFSLPFVKPFVEGGLSFDHLAGLTSAAKGIVTSSGMFLHQSDASVVLGGGVDVKIPFFRLSGELRYTRQTVSNFVSFSNLNQAEVLLGVHF
jgi:hypothetical protein